jgi:hypothetical protein
MKAKLAKRKDLDTMIQLADKLVVQKRNDEAQAVLVQALEHAVTEFGADSQKVAQVLVSIGDLNLAGTIRSQDNHGRRADSIDYAKDCYMAALRIEKKKVGRKHPSLVHITRQLAICCTQQGLANVAEILNLQAELIRKANGVEDPTIAILEKLVNMGKDTPGGKAKAASSLNTLAHLYEMKGDVDKAAELQERYLKAREEEFGADSLQMANEYYTRAITLVSLSELTQSVELKKKQLENEKGLPGQDNKTVEASDAKNGAETETETGPGNLTFIDERATKRAMEYLKKAADIYERNVSEATLYDLSWNYSHLTWLCLHVNDLATGEKVARRCVEHVETYYPNSFLLTNPLIRLETVLQLKGDEDAYKAVQERRLALPPQTEQEKKLLNERIKAVSQRAMERIMGSLTNSAASEELNNILVGHKDDKSVDGADGKTADKADDKSKAQ